MKIFNTKISLADAFGNSWRYWERQRIAYNSALFIVVLGWVVLTWPHFLPGFNFRADGAMCVLAVLANVCYSAIYLADLPLQCSSARTAWLRWRWIVLLLGILFALTLEMYWIADEVYPHPTGP